MLGAMRHDQRGATTLELAVVLVPFFVLVFGIIEVAIVYWASHELENATDHAARLIRTGHVRRGNLDALALKQRLCSRAFVLQDCEARLRLDVRSWENFAALPLPSHKNFGYAPGKPNHAVRVAVFYEWPLMNMISSISISNLPNGNRLLQATSVFRNEPTPEE